MKKVLFATTALIATGTVAAADITLSGYGRFGLRYTDVAGVTDTNLENRVNIDIKGSGETDGGLSFGGKIRMRGNGGAVATLNGVQVHIATGGLTVYAGNIPGALDSMAGVYAPMVGYTGGTFSYLVTNGDTLAYSSQGAGANGVQANYSMGGLTVMAAYAEGADDSQLVAQYSMGDFTIAAGAQFGDVAADDVMAVTAGYSSGPLSVTLGYGDNNGTELTVLTVGYDISSATNANVYVADTNAAGSTTGYGIGFTHNIGGATIGAAYEERTNGNAQAELGIKFNF